MEFDVSVPKLIDLLTLLEAFTPLLRRHIYSGVSIGIKDQHFQLFLTANIV